MALGLSIANVGCHSAAWRHPDSPTAGAMDFEPYRRGAALAEAGRFDFIYLADTAAVLGLDEPALARGGQVPQVKLEPLALLAALSAIISRVGLVPSVSSTYTDPYNIARGIGALDHLSQGRAGWNLVTGCCDDEARNFGLDAIPPPEERDARATEFLEVVHALFDGWDDDAVPRDKVSGVFFERAKMHMLDHRGRFFKVRGPLDLPPLPQRHPPVFTTSAESQDLAARFADVVHTDHGTLEDARSYCAAVKRRLARYGRTPEGLLILPGLMTYVGRTRQEAQDKFDRLQGLAVGGSGRSLRAIGTAADIADVMEEWVTTGAADGFNLLPPCVPISIEDFVTMIIPELQRRELFRFDYEGRTLRAHLGLPVAVSRYAREQA
jgi:FMN-dependent oxidoreductase (nitrilotriacetate monooxygenase family)